MLITADTNSRSYHISYGGAPYRQRPTSENEVRSCNAKCTEPREYRSRANDWRVNAAKLPVGETRAVYLEIAEGYERLAEIFERSPAMQYSD